MYMRGRERERERGGGERQTDRQADRHRERELTPLNLYYIVVDEPAFLRGMYLWQVRSHGLILALRLFPVETRHVIEIVAVTLVLILEIWWTGHDSCCESNY